MKVLAVIPARGGSKGVKRKNIRPLHGKPLIAHAIECAMDSEKISYFTVSTDDEEIAAVARNFGAPVIMRPAELATDQAPMLPVLFHALELATKEQQMDFDLVVLLQTTSPLRSAEDVDNVIEMFEEDLELDGVISVIELKDIHPGLMYTLDSDQTMHCVLPNCEAVNRQNMPPVYYRNGCIYAVRPKAMIRENSLMVKNKKAYVMPTEWHANIDEEADFLNAATLFKRWKETLCIYSSLNPKTTIKTP
jgi:CMP-N,N'-diacetyllegionaminic acid synthase